MQNICRIHSLQKSVAMLLETYIHYQGVFVESGRRLATSCSGAQVPNPPISLVPTYLLQRVGLVFNPATPLDHAKYVLDKIDIILLMSVNPGFGGQSFIPSTLDKLREARKMIDESGYDIRLEVT